MGQRSDPQVTARVARNCLAFREESGLTQQQAAERAGVALSTLFKIEQGLSAPSPSTMMKLAGVYRRDVGDFTAATPPAAGPPPETPTLALKTLPGADLAGLPREDVKRITEQVEKAVAEANHLLAELRKKKGVMAPGRAADGERRGRGRPPKR